MISMIGKSLCKPEGCASLNPYRKFLAPALFITDMVFKQGGQNNEKSPRRNVRRRQGQTWFADSDSICGKNQRSAFKTVV